jgi:hypothetical protein
MTTTDELLKRIEELEQEQAQLQTQLAQTKEQYQQVTGLFEQFKHGSISRRAFLTSVTALAGAGFMAGSASAAPDYTNASGTTGTETQPLSSANIKQLNAQQIGSDTNRSEIYGDSVDANSVNTEELGNDSADLDIITSLFVSETAEFNGSGSGQGGEGDTAINIRSGGPNSSRKLVFSDSSGNSVYLQMVGGELIVTDDDGNETTLS